MARTVNKLPAIGTRVRVHLNLHRAAKGLPDAWSITIAGKNVAYVASVCLRDVTPKYLRTKQAGTLAGGKRTVHAWLEGTLCDMPAGEVETWECVRVCYNPKARPQCTEFHTPTGATITGARYVAFTGDRRAYAFGVR